MDAEVSTRSRELWASVIGRAIADLGRKNHRSDALRWLNDRKRRNAGSFIWVCESLGWNADAIRSKVLKEKD